MLCFAVACVGAVLTCRVSWAGTDPQGWSVSSESLRNTRETVRGWSSQYVMPCRKKFITSSLGLLLMLLYSWRQRGNLFEFCEKCRVYFLWSVSIQMYVDRSKFLSGSDTVMSGWYCAWINQNWMELTSGRTSLGCTCALYWPWIYWR